MTGSLAKCVVVGGAGAVGRMFVELLTQAAASVTVIDSRVGAGVPPQGPGDSGNEAGFASLGEAIAGDVTAPSNELCRALRAADLVLLAVPERVALAALAAVTAQMRDGALLAHTASVQLPLALAMRDTAQRLQALGLNPMFAPALGMRGRPVAAVVVNDGASVGELLGLVSQAGARVVPVDAETHDRVCAAGQALAHATVLSFALALTAMDVDLRMMRALAPPPLATLLALVARIVSGAPTVYWEIQSENRYAAGARGALARGLEHLAQATQDEAAFTSVMNRSRGFLGPELEPLSEYCAELFSVAGHAPATARSAAGPPRSAEEHER